MIRNAAIGAILGAGVMAWTPATWAETTPPPTDPSAAAPTDSSNWVYGVFRENVFDAPVSQRACWVQAMADGNSINGQLLAQRVSQQEAQCVLVYAAATQQCPNAQLTADTAFTGPDTGPVDQGYTDWLASLISAANASTDSTNSDGTPAAPAGQSDWDQTRLAAAYRTQQQWNALGCTNSYVAQSVGNPNSDGLFTGNSDPWSEDSIEESSATTPNGPPIGN